MSANGDYNNPNAEFPSDRRSANSSRSNAWLNLEIEVKADRPELLEGLDRWLQLNLIDHEQIKRIARRHLSCTLPKIEVAKSLPLPENIPQLPESIAEPASVNIFSRILQGFLDELSIRWLLFLGIFLVVISSGVLAASQWQNFPVVGQYFVLLIYTVGFWGIGFWTSKQDLKLTSQTLNAIATLLIPINFWAISHLGLGKNLVEWSIIAVAATVLTATTFFSRRQKTERNLFFIPLFLLLSYLHLGWQVPLFALLSIYGGITAISLTYYRFLSLQDKYSTVDFLFLLAAWSLLLARKLTTDLAFIPNYCLAIAMFAWLLATIYLTRLRKLQAISSDRQSATVADDFFGRICQIVSIALFIAAWSVSVIRGTIGSPTFFWQTVGIGILAIQLFSQRLTLYWHRRDLTAIFFIGLQTLYISKELIPNNLRSEALNLSVAVSKTEYFPESVFGVTLFPYVILFVGVASWLYRRQKPQLALYAEYLTLLLGIVLICLSISNPTWRSLNLLLSTTTLGYVARMRQPIRIFSTYLAHLLSLITVINAIDFVLPHLNLPIWGSIVIVLTAIEWGIYLYRVKYLLSGSFLSQLKQSCWYFGLFLSALSYTCFLAHIEASNLTPNSFRWGLVWLITPGMLTLVAQYTRKVQQRRLATTISCIALIAAQLLTFGQPETRAIGLAVGVGLMFINAFNLRRTNVTVIHIGFALSLIVSLLASSFGGLINSWDWLSVGAAAILGLYQLRLRSIHNLNNPKFSYISQRRAHGILGVGVEAQNFKLIGKYIKATDYWAIALIAIELTIVSVIYPNLGNRVDPQYLFTTGLLIVAIWWRYHQQPNNLVLYTLTWLWSLFAVGLVGQLGEDSLIFATTNIILGLASLVVAAWFVQLDSPWARLNWACVPLIYAGLGILWRLSHFNAYTGLLTLGAAFVLHNTQHKNKRVDAFINYLSFAGISCGIYEIVIYQMQSSSGGSTADALTILALVAAAIAFSYRLLAWWCRQRQTRTLFNLRLAQVVPIAHLHWGIASLLKILAASIAIENITPRFTLVSIATSFCLGAYAVIQGRDRLNTSERDWWVYIGLVEITATLFYSRLIISKLSLFDPWRIVFTCAIASLIYQIPWQNLGWRATPWQRTALISPALMALVTAEDISYFSLFVTALFYLRIAYAQGNIRWSYLSLGFTNWIVIRWVGQYSAEPIWLAGIISLSILYVAQYDPYYKLHRSQRHYLRSLGCSIFCLVAAFARPGIMPIIVGFCLIFVGLGLRIRAFLFTGTITLILSVIHQLIILVLTYSFLKWIIGLLTGIASIAIAAGFEKQRDRALSKVRNYSSQLQDWQ